MTQNRSIDESTVPGTTAHTSGQTILPLLVGCFSIGILLPGQSIAQQTDTQMPQAPQAPTVESLDSSSSPASTTSELQPPELGATLELNLRQADGQDNESDLRRDTGELEVQLTLGIEQEWDPFAKLVGQLELNSRRFTEDALNDEDQEFSYDLERLFVQLDPSSSFRIRAGRFGLDDPMETIVDEDLDGVQVSISSGSIDVELSHTREDWFEASTIERFNQITNSMGSVKLSPNKKSFWMPYALHRSVEAFNNDRPLESTWFGIQGIVEPDNSAVRYWVHGSVQDGEETREDEIIEIGGYLVDLGINWTAAVPLEPTFTLAVAHASGGAREDRFRQSGLHSNDFALNDKNSFRYLGEVMDPELTNIQIVTFGVGADLSKDWSADLAIHHYQQVELQSTIRGADIEYDPLGVNDELGLGADIVVAYEPNKRIDVKGTFGAFAPGDAFDDDQDMAWLALLELDYNF